MAKNQTEFYDYYRRERDETRNYVSSMPESLKCFLSQRREIFHEK